MLIYKMSNGNFNNSKEKFYWGIIPYDCITIRSVFYYMDMSHNPCDSLFRYTEEFPAVLHFEITPEIEGKSDRQTKISYNMDIDMDMEKLLEDPNEQWYTWEQLEFWYEKMGDLAMDITDDIFDDYRSEFFRLGMKTYNTKIDRGFADVSLNNLKYFKKDLQ